MPKVKVKRHGVSLDMTAMCDVAFLLLTFFILTTKFKPNEALPVDTPTSVSDLPIPDSDLITISIGKDNQIFFGVDAQPTREAILTKVAQDKGITLNAKQMKNFKLMDNFGVSIAALPAFLNLEGSDLSGFKQPGIPCDSLVNELSAWVLQARYANPKSRIAIKGDKGSDAKVVSKVIATLQDQNINRFNLITGMEAKPMAAGM
ncbi:MAG: biopolymer transporter ExbD [Cytophagales bacterium]|nr:MAG: biopolymer transporter ExbD [Cytophagales bacterium]